MKPDCAHEEGTHCIHSSERRAFRGCRRRWDWSFRDHYTPARTHKALEFGIAFHEGMEQIYEPSRWHTTTDEQKLEYAIAAFTEIVTAQRTNYLKESHQEFAQNPIGDDYAERMDLGIGMLNHYVRNVHPQADRFYEPVKVEVPFSVPLVYPEGLRLPNDAKPGDQLTCSRSSDCGQEHPNPAPVTLNGRVDAIFEDIVNGGYYIVDWKSAAQLISDGEFLQMDDQVSSYCAALSLILNIDVRGFLYAEIRKDYPRPPEPLKREYRGRKFSTNANQATTPKLARQTFMEGDLAGYEAGFYDEYLKKLEQDPPKFHQRFPIIQPESKLANVLKNVAMEAMDIIDPDLLIYPAPSKMNCSGCAFKAPCLAKFEDEPYEYTLKSMFGRK